MQKHSATRPGAVPALPLDQLREIFAARDDVRMAALFGSRALGQSRPESDYDIAVLMSRPGDGLETGFFTLFSELAELMGIKEENLDLTDLSRLHQEQKARLQEGYVLLKGSDEELKALLA